MAQAYEDLRQQVDQSGIRSGDHLLLLRMGFLSWSRSQAQSPHAAVAGTPVASTDSAASSELLHIVVNMIASNLLFQTP